MAETLNELDAIDKYIYDKLVAQGSAFHTLIDTAGGFHKLFSGVAPREVKTASGSTEAVEPPYVLWDLLDARDVNALGRARIFTRPIMIVRAVTQSSSYATANAIADYIDAALHNSSAATPVTGIMVMGFDRQQLVRTTNVTGSGIRWNYVGGIYRGFVCRA